MSAARVVITGLGAVVGEHDDSDTLFDALMRGESSLRLLQPSNPDYALAAPAVQCSKFDAFKTLGEPLAHQMDRYSQLGAAAAISAWQNAGLANDIDRPKAGVFWGTALGGIGKFEQGYEDLFLRGRKRLSPMSVVLGMNNAAAAHIAILHQLGGASLTYSIACSSSAVAIGEAFQRVRAGVADIAIAGGSDCPLGYGVMRAWEAMRVLAPGDANTAYKACRPFSADRAGLTLGEGAAALILENRDAALARGARIYAELVGYGLSCDHHHLVRPKESGQIRAIQQALADGGLHADDIDYVNAHGTATQEGDPIEIAAIRGALGAHAKDVAVSATKSMHGHLMGATGAVEALITTLAIHKQAVPPTAHLEKIDAACEGVRHIAKQGERLPVRAALSNSFAFGGTNAVLAFKTHP